MQIIPSTKYYIGTTSVNRNCCASLRCCVFSLYIWNHNMKYEQKLYHFFFFLQWYIYMHCRPQFIYCIGWVVLIEDQLNVHISKFKVYISKSLNQLYTDTLNLFYRSEYTICIHHTILSPASWGLFRKFRTYCTNYGFVSKKISLNTADKTGSRDTYKCTYKYIININ